MPDERGSTPDRTVGDTTGRIMVLEAAVGQFDRSLTAVTSLLQRSAERLDNAVLEMKQHQVKVAAEINGLRVELAHHEQVSNADREKTRADLDTVRMARARESGAHAVVKSYAGPYGSKVILGAVVLLLTLFWTFATKHFVDEAAAKAAEIMRGGKP